jgi:F0F1-type ATP synthase delta subunit
MIENILKSLLFEVLDLLNKQKGLLNESKDSRHKALKDVENLPEEIKNYLAEVKEEQFLADVNELVHFLNSGALNLRGEMAMALKNFFTGSFSELLDNEDKLKMKGKFANSVNDLLENNSDKEVTLLINNFIGLIDESPFIMVQSPRPIEVKLKKQIREKLSEKYGASFVNFAINKNLVGGLRIFVNGETVDLSWLSKINTITNIK